MLVPAATVAADLVKPATTPQTAFIVILCVASSQSALPDLAINFIVYFPQLELIQ